MPNLNNITLLSSIDELPLSESLKEILQQHSFTVLGEVTKLTVADLLTLRGITIHHLTEFVSFLEKYDLAGVLKHSA